MEAEMQDTPTEHAAALGTEHGRRDAEAWHAAMSPRDWIGTGSAQRWLNAFDRGLNDLERSFLPEPDLRTFADDNVDWTIDVDETYCDAYRAAVEETIKGKVTS